MIRTILSLKTGVGYSRIVEVKAPPSLSLEGRLGIIARIGEILEDVLGCEVSLKNFPLIGLIDAEGHHYYVNRYAAVERYIGECTYPLRFLHFVVSFINMLKEVVGPKVRSRWLGNFRMEGSKDGWRLTAKVSFKRDRDLTRVRVSLSALIKGDVLPYAIPYSLESIVRRIENTDIFRLVTIELRKVNPYGLSKKEKTFLIRSARTLFLEELFSLLDEVRPRRNDVRFVAGVDLFPYGVDVREVIKSALRYAEEISVGRKTKLSLERLRGFLMRLGGHEEINAAIDNIDEGELAKALDEIEEFFLRRGIKDNPISGLRPRKEIVFKLWERDYSDVFMGHYSGTCLALDSRGKEEMPKYLRDEYTEFLRVIVNGRRIGHVKLFECIDEDGSDVFYVDYIALSGGKYRELHEDLKAYALSAAIKLTQIKGLRRTYVAKSTIGDLKAPLLKRRLRKKGMMVYMQYLDEPKYLIWDSDEGC